MVPLLLLLLNTIHAKVSYTGFALTMAKDIIPDYYFNTYKEAISEEFNSKSLPNINGIILGGLLAINLRQLKAENLEFNNLKHSSDIDDQTIKVEHNNAAIFKMRITFNYIIKVFGIDLPKNEGTLEFSLNELTIAQKFNEYKSNTTVSKIKVDQIVTKITGFNFFWYIRDWIQSLFTNGEGRIVLERVKECLKKGTEDSFSSFYFMKPFPNTRKVINMTLNNKLTNLQEHPKGHMLMTYDTRISVDDKAYSKTLFRHIKTIWNESIPAFGICTGKNMIPAIAEVRGKQRDFLIVIPTKEIGLSGTLQEFYSIMPMLQGKLKPDQGINIGCMVNPDNDIVLLDKSDIHNIQIPLNCIFNTDTIGEELLVVDFTGRWSVENRLSNNDSYFFIEPRFNSTEIEDLKFKVVSSMVPVEDLVLLRTILFGINSKIKNETLFPFFPEKIHLNTREVLKAGYKGIIEPFVEKDIICIGYPKVH